MSTHYNSDSPNLDSAYFTTPSTVATSTFASGSPIIKQEAYLTDSPASTFSFNFENSSDGRRTSLGPFAPYAYDNVLVTRAASNGQFSEPTFEGYMMPRNDIGNNLPLLELLSSLVECESPHNETTLIDLEAFLRSDPFEKAEAQQEMVPDITFKQESPREWFFEPPPPLKREKVHSPIQQKKFLEQHNSSTLTKPRLRKAKSFSYAISKKQSSAAPATPLQSYVREFHVNEGTFPIQDETASFLKPLSNPSVRKKIPGSKSAMLRRSKTSANLSINSFTRLPREHRTMEAGLNSFQLRLNHDSKS